MYAASGYFKIAFGDGNLKKNIISLLFIIVTKQIVTLIAVGGILLIKETHS